MKADIKKMEATRDNLQAQIESLTGQVDNAKRTSASDGVWQVGKDIDAGTYRANDSVTDRCYWEVSVGDDIVQNDMPGGLSASSYRRWGLDVPILPFQRIGAV